MYKTKEYDFIDINEAIEEEVEKTLKRIEKRKGNDTTIKKSEK